MKFRNPLPTTSIILFYILLLLGLAYTIDAISGAEPYPHSQADKRTGPCQDGIGTRGPSNYTDGTCVTELQVFAYIVPLSLLATTFFDAWVWTQRNRRQE